jgi:hypothetical protein
MGGDILIRPWLAALLAFGLCAVAARAQTGDGLPDPGDLGTGGRHVIQGRLYLPSGRKLDRRLRVRLSGVGGGENTTLTDDNGAFTFRRLTAGTYTLTVEGGRDFETATETVDVFDGTRRTDQQVYTVQIRLEEKRAAPTRRGRASSARRKPCPRRRARVTLMRSKRPRPVTTRRRSKS